jgi:hypothetical protein
MKTVIADVQQLWQAFWNAQIVGYSLNKAPIISSISHYKTVHQKGFRL